MKNSIFRKLSYVKSNFRKKKKKKLKFHVKFPTLLDFHLIEFFIKTRFFKNQVSSTGAFCYIILEYGHFTTPFGRKWQIPILAQIMG